MGSVKDGAELLNCNCDLVVLIFGCARRGVGESCCDGDVVAFAARQSSKWTEEEIVTVFRNHGSLFPCRDWTDGNARKVRLV